MRAGSRAKGPAAVGAARRDARRRTRQRAGAPPRRGVPSARAVRARSPRPWTPGAGAARVFKARRRSAKLAASRRVARQQSAVNGPSPSSRARVGSDAAPPQPGAGRFDAHARSARAQWHLDVAHRDATRPIPARARRRWPRRGRRVRARRRQRGAPARPVSQRGPSPPDRRRLAAQLDAPSPSLGPRRQRSTQATARRTGVSSSPPPPTRTSDRTSLPRPSAANAPGKRAL